MSINNKPIDAEVTHVKTTLLDSAAIVLTMESNRRELRNALRPHPADDQRLGLRENGPQQVEHVHPSTDQQGPDRLKTSTSTAQSKIGSGIWLPIVKTLLTKWWQQHPARLALQVAENTIEQQARVRPVAFLAAGAVLGSAIVLIKPWRRMGLALLFIGLAGAKSAGTLSKTLELVKEVTRTR
jgi:hypothetical protein